ncbi:glycoside hydrolase family 2 TIM barrel-domain containing protein [Gracilibacillus sp. YIM 98692]|uniref:glycoside hydrolase family 2 protein n=1 Tax=Gracilibacillus sp. YIM 98692 TaxID=2663532 RepID=UPI0013D46DE4|nr:glycoside hydrolase family 2 TIM barrel-domain containing protein [Gracilibacillus sp. YIM 98692]
MIRLFDRHRVRKYVELDGLWDFQPVENDDHDVSAFRYQLPVPSCWESHPDLTTYRGKGLYRKKINIAKQTNLQFECKGISHTAEVYFDGKKVKSHYNAYTPFSFIIPDVQAGEHEIRILVDNRFTSESALHIPNDYYTYGGIIRPIVMEYLPEVSIANMKCVPQYQEQNWHLHLEVDLQLLQPMTDMIYVSGKISEKTFSIVAKIPKTGDRLQLQHQIKNLEVESWSSDNPRLYEVELELYTEYSNQPVDDYIERIGFRTVSTDNGKIQINGDDIVLKGCNRHEDHPIVGASFPLQLMMQDLQLLKDMGANAVRTSHYPNDERFLDLCDELGFYVWEENHARGLSLERMQHPQFQNQCQQVNQEMVENHVNHPCIIMWGILNECASHTEEGRAMYREQLKQIRSMDNSRPLTFASHHREKELCFDLVDIVSFNLYPLWYTDEDPSELVDQARKWADELGGKGKPMIMSEFGADGFYGYRTISQVKGTEERQAQIIDENLKSYMETDYISGMFIWQFADCRVTEEEWFMKRAQTMNNKGIVDMYRRPKLAYDKVKNRWRRG